MNLNGIQLECECSSKKKPIVSFTRWAEQNKNAFYSNARTQPKKLQKQRNSSEATIKIAHEMKCFCISFINHTRCYDFHFTTPPPSSIQYLSHCNWYLIFSLSLFLFNSHSSLAYGRCFFWLQNICCFYMFARCSFQFCVASFGRSGLMVVWYIQWI